MSKQDGMPEPHVDSFMCPFCSCTLWFERRVHDKMIYAHWTADPEGVNYHREFCPNNGAIFMFHKSDNGALLMQRMEPIV